MPLSSIGLVQHNHTVS